MADQLQPCSECTTALRLVSPLQPGTAILAVSRAYWDPHLQQPEVRRQVALAVLIQGDIRCAVALASAARGLLVTYEVT